MKAWVLLLAVIPTLIRAADHQESSGITSSAQGMSSAVIEDGGILVREGIILIKFRDSPGIFNSSGKRGTRPWDAKLSRYGVTGIEKMFPGLGAQPPYSEINKIYRIHYQSSDPPRVVARDFSRDPEVEYALPSYVYRIDQPDRNWPQHQKLVSIADPNDPLYSQMSQLKLIKAPPAWDIVKGEDGNVVIAIVDGGTDWQHEDLLDNIWINPGESGLDETGGDRATNGKDDDGNGYTDDVRGWNFTRNSNDPTGLATLPEVSAHGTAVAGVASAVTNNGTGMAGASWNATILPICASCPQEELICYSFEGIVYAAENGAAIINASWGSDFGDLGPDEQAFLLALYGDIVIFARSKGALIVAAAGNDGFNIDERLYLPASAKHVLAVGGTLKNSDYIYIETNYGASVDAFAPAHNIEVTLPDNEYASNWTGTSLATPLVAGVAALAKTRFPELGPVELGQQIRVTADNIEDSNSELKKGLLGRGRVNALRAVTENTNPAIRIADFSAYDSEGDPGIDNGETVTLEVACTNFLNAVSNITLTLESPEVGINLLQDRSFIPYLAKGNTVSVSFEFQLDQVAFEAPLLLYVNMVTDNYADRDLIKLYANRPLFANHNTGPLEASIINTGNIGWSGFEGSVGTGFNYNNDSLLFEGGLMIGAFSQEVSDCIRTSDLGRERDFIYSPDTVFAVNPGTGVSEIGTLLLSDNFAENPLGLAILLETFADTRDEYNDFIIVKYTVSNSTDESLNNVYIGTFFDWDISSDPGTDAGRFDQTRRMGIVQNQAQDPTILAASRLLAPVTNYSYRSIDNESEIYGGEDRDGFTEGEKWRFLSQGIQTRSLDQKDVSTLLASGPHIIPGGKAVEVVFAILAAHSRQALNTNSDNAQQFWDQYLSGLGSRHPPVITNNPDGLRADVWETFTFEYEVDDPDNDPLTFTLIDPPDNVSIDSARGILAFIPSVDQIGRHKITTLVSDGIYSATSIGYVTVNEIDFQISSLYPNPVNIRTERLHLNYQLAERSEVRLVIYDLRGRQVRTLINENLPIGRYLVTWDGKNDRGQFVGAGLYLYHLVVNSKSGTNLVRKGKLILLK